ncbi:hypothetical protein [Mucilaginibacter sp.]|uniref:hypothetical protein n=1 Tax=Mucilaginibacter sp. TaxID=1882438 RepID=UPI002636A2E6|nr:hypothetical protein [Mucilaginibacter sp.]MDB5127505.1 hypothetical protein [Mucilaginibacter sp.]
MWNPIRRNRNLGTSKQGHGQNNKLTIAKPCMISKSFYERLDFYNKVERTINGHTFIFVIETTRQSCYHACSVMDIEKIVENIPISDYGDLKLIVLRQPKRKEEMISPVWGRLIYSYEFEDNYYPAIIVEAVDYSKKINWNRSQTPEDQREFERLKIDGHHFLESKKTFNALLQIDNVRNTQLYRTLIHEFGHYKQYLEIVERAGHEDEDFEEWNKRNEKYFKISSSDKESYAHKYADELINKLREENIVPFDRISDIYSDEKMVHKKSSQ